MKNRVTYINLVEMNATQMKWFKRIAWLLGIKYPNALLRRWLIDTGKATATEVVLPMRLWNADDVINEHNRSTFSWPT